MKTKPHNVGLKMKDMHISVDSQVIRKALPKNKKLWPGLKKGSGQLPGVGPGSMGGGEGAAEGLSFARTLLRLSEEAAALEDITDEQPVDANAVEGGAEELPTDDGSTDPLASGEPTERYVRGAHLVYKREVETGQFEELWIFSIDPQTKKDHESTPLKAILAGTDIPENATQSEDGTQSYSLWTAGNAQYVHIKGLPN